MNTKELGDLGEQIACEYLVKKGYNILERNYRITLGEIDIIARKKWGLFKKSDRTIHFVEVKTLATSHAYFSPEDRVGLAKQRKLRTLCQIWLQKHHLNGDQPYQIDVISVTMGNNPKEYKVEFFENTIEDNF